LPIACVRCQFNADGALRPRTGPENTAKPLKYRQLIAKAHEKFDANGNYIDEVGKNLARQLLENLVKWTRRLNPPI